MPTRGGLLMVSKRRNRCEEPGGEKTGKWVQTLVRIERFLLFYLAFFSSSNRNKICWCAAWRRVQRSTTIRSERFTNPFLNWKRNWSLLWSRNLSGSWHDLPAFLFNVNLMADIAVGKQNLALQQALSHSVLVLPSGNTSGWISR